MEYYAQSTNTWTYTASLPQTLYGESAVYDGNGHIFAFGGVGASGSILSTVYEYTIATNSWLAAASMPIAVSDSAAVLASNNVIYVLGGKTNTGTTAAVESYNPATNTWNTETSLPSPVSNEAVVGDSLGRIEILGGYDSNGNALANVWVSQRLNTPDSAPSFTSSSADYGCDRRRVLLPGIYHGEPAGDLFADLGPDGHVHRPEYGPDPVDAGCHADRQLLGHGRGQQLRRPDQSVVRGQRHPVAAHHPDRPDGHRRNGLVHQPVLECVVRPIGVSSYRFTDFYITGHTGEAAGTSTITTPL